MSKTFERGLVVGKFAPLHRGHQAVIARAEELCEQVVLISYANPELAGCDPQVRARWLAELYPAATRLVVTDAIAPVPADDADDTTHRRFVGFLCQQVLGLRVDVVFTSEAYGDGFARELTRLFQERDSAAPVVRHVSIDQGRVKVPISGTAIRADIHAHRQWLHPAVYASFVERICFLGGESTGKSTLVRELALGFNTVAVPEYGRELWEAKEGVLEFADLRQIAEKQVNREEKALRQANRFAFCDTTPLTTLSYSLEMFGEADPVVHALAQRPYAWVFLCAPDFAFVQDGTRRDHAFRAQQHAWYVAELNRRKVSFHTLRGPIENRISEVRRVLAPKS
ncbi:MAG: AAA family ATPase [Opitutaceae bacterium]